MLLDGSSPSPQKSGYSQLHYKNIQLPPTVPNNAIMKKPYLVLNQKKVIGRNNIFLKPPTPAYSFGPQRQSLFTPENERDKLQLNMSQNSFSTSDINQYSTI
jgi:hypothetical protein